MSGTIDLAILPYAPKLSNLASVPFITERLSAILPPEHRLANRSSIALSELDGETFLMYNGVGFWRELLRDRVPNAHYVLQDDYLVFSQLAPTSPLPGFATDASETERFAGHHRIVAIEDEDATARYHLVSRVDSQEQAGDLENAVGAYDRAWAPGPSRRTSKLSTQG